MGEPRQHENVHYLEIFRIYPLLPFYKCLLSSLGIFFFFKFLKTFLTLFPWGKGGVSITMVHLMGLGPHAPSWVEQYSPGYKK